MSEGTVASNPIDNPAVKAVFDAIRAGDHAAVAGAAEPIQVEEWLRSRTAEAFIEVFDEFAAGLGDPPPSSEFTGPKFAALLREQYGIGLGAVTVTVNTGDPAAVLAHVHEITAPFAAKPAASGPAPVPDLPTDGGLSGAHKPGRVG